MKNQNDSKRSKRSLRKQQKKANKLKVEKSPRVISYFESGIIYSFSLAISILFYVDIIDITLFSLQYFIALLFLLYIFRHSTAIGLDDFFSDSDDDSDFDFFDGGDSGGD